MEFNEGEWTSVREIEIFATLGVRYIKILLYLSMYVMDTVLSSSSCQHNYS